MEKYNHKEIEPKWQKEWKKEGIYKTEKDSKKERTYILDMFPYPSGDGLHVGHPKGYIATDIYSRFKRMSGYNVLHPMGWDAFGLPAENYALKNKVHPRIAVEKNVSRFKEQLSMIGFDYDWDREINTTDPEYYRWTQWIFLKLFEKGLAYESDEPINWCPSCKTGLANEDLEPDGTCERCGTQTEKKPLRQWVLKIREYADRLLSDIDKLNWPESIKESQRNWIGRSEGALLKFQIQDTKYSIQVFTTRPDTLFGATYVVLAPEHALVHELEDRTENIDEVKKYVEEASKKSEIDRTAEGREKTGVELKGVKAINPANKEEIPVFIADYVLAEYGTGAIMAVPAHDERDFEFARQFNLPVPQVVTRPEDNIRSVEALIRTTKGTLVFQKRDKDAPTNQGKVTLFGGGRHDGEDLGTALRRELREELDLRSEEQPVSFFGYFRSPFGSNTFVTIFLVDAVDSRKLNLKEGEALLEMTLEEALDRSDLTDFTMAALLQLSGSVGIEPYEGEGFLVNSGKFDGMSTEKARGAITKHVGGKMTVDYKIRDWVFSRQRYWGEPIPIIHCQMCGPVPVPESDLPVLLPEVKNYEPTGTGESPLANVDEWVNTKCPKCGGFGKRETNTMPQWAGSSWYYLRYIDPDNNKALVDKKKEKYWSPVDLYVGGAEHATRHLIYARFWHKFLFDIGVVNYGEPFTRLQHVGLIQAEDGRKMSKRWGNVINPDDVIDKMGADTLRIYEMFMGPFDSAVSWSTDGITGVRRFLDKLWRVTSVNTLEGTDLLGGVLHKTIKKVGGDIELFKFNTAISQMMIFVNHADKNGINQEELELFLKVLAPFAPHITEELWQRLGHKGSIHTEEWPEYDKALLVEDEVTIVVQVNGRVRAQFVAPSGISEEEVIKKAIAQESVRGWIKGKSPKKVIYVPDRLLNLVV